MVTQLVAGRVFDYSRLIGRGAVSGAGFNTPIAMWLAGEDKVYVVNRGAEYIPGGCVEPECAWGAGRRLLHRRRG